MSEQKINDEIIAKKAAELIDKFGNPIMDDVNGCYITKGRNTWSKEKYSYNLAIIAHYSNEGCSYCHDCENCKNCIQCENCKNCDGCKLCRYSNDCLNSTSLWSCNKCEKCFNCEECTNCRDCESCKKCKNCISCKSSKDLNEKTNYELNKEIVLVHEEILPSIQDILNSR